MGTTTATDGTREDDDGVHVGPYSLTDLRQDTPSTSQVLHFNAAGASPPPSCVLERHIAHLNLEAKIGGYAAVSGIYQREDG